MDVARPRSDGIRSAVIESECGQDQHRIAGSHQASRDPISSPSPTVPDVQGNERTQQHQNRHGSSAMHHQHVGGRHLPRLAARCVLHLIAHEPPDACNEQDRERPVDREPKAWVKPQGTQRSANPESSRYLRRRKPTARSPGTARAKQLRPGLRS